MKFTPNYRGPELSRFPSLRNRSQNCLRRQRRHVRCFPGRPNVVPDAALVGYADETRIYTGLQRPTATVVRGHTKRGLTSTPAISDRTRPTITGGVRSAIPNVFPHATTDS